MLFLKQMFYKIECQLLCVPYFCIFKGICTFRNKRQQGWSFLLLVGSTKGFGEIGGVLEMLTKVSFEIVIIHTSAIPYDCR